MGAYVWPVDNWQTTDGAKYTGRRLRQMLGAVLTGKTAARPLGARSGVVAGTPTSTVSATSSTWTVAPHVGVIDAQTTSNAGAYWYSIDANATGAVPAADASQDRTDLVVVQVSDPAESDGTSAPGVAVVYVQGTPGGGAPATPARSLALARVFVPHLGAGSPSVTWLAPFTVAAGGILPASSTAYPSSPYVGQYVDDATLGLLRWTGSKWEQVRAGMWYGEADAGTASVALADTSLAYPLSDSKVTFTLGTQRRVRIVGSARFKAAASGSIGQCSPYLYVASGAAIPTSGFSYDTPPAGTTAVSAAGRVIQAAPTVGQDADVEHSIVLAAGTWSAFVGARRALGGSTTDTASNAYLAVYDAGPA